MYILLLEGSAVAQLLRDDQEGIPGDLGLPLSQAQEVLHRSGPCVGLESSPSNIREAMKCCTRPPRWMPERSPHWDEGKPL